MFKGLRLSPTGEDALSALGAFRKECPLTWGREVGYPCRQPRAIGDEYHFLNNPSQDRVLTGVKPQVYACVGKEVERQMS